MIISNNEKVGYGLNVVSRNTEWKAEVPKPRSLADRWRHLTIPDGKMRRKGDYSSCHACIKNSRRYGYLSELGT